MYYYTSSDTMSKILKGGSIWATNLSYMNDAREYVNGFNEIKKILKSKDIVEEWTKKTNIIRLEDYKDIKIDNVLSDKRRDSYVEASSRFTISFCKHKDLLSQWITYAKESGVCLEMQFDLSKECRFLLYKRNDGDDSKDRKRNVKVLTRPQEIYYCTSERNSQEEYREVSFKILDYLFRYYDKNNDLSKYLTEKWEETSVFVKQYDFYQEEEYRLSFDLSNAPEIGYRSDNHLLKPYLDIAIESGWPIASIMVGPGGNQSPVYNSIKFFLDHENIKTSLLCTIDQWRAHIRTYLEKSKKISDSWKHWGNNRVKPPKGEESYFEFFNFLSGMKQEYLDMPDKMENLHRKIKEIASEDEECFQQYYFTKSGIILEKSMIPYIY